MLKNAIMKNFLRMLVVSALGGVLTLGGYVFFFEHQEVAGDIDAVEMPSVIPSSYEPATVAAAENTDFTVVAEKSMLVIDLSRSVVDQNLQIQSIIRILLWSIRRNRKTSSRIGFRCHHIF